MAWSLLLVAWGIWALVRKILKNAKIAAEKPTLKEIPGLRQWPDEGGHLVS
jgi:hypothetical protein